MRTYNVSPDRGLPLDSVALHWSDRHGCDSRVEVSIVDGKLLAKVQKTIVVVAGIEQEATFAVKDIDVYL